MKKEKITLIGGGSLLWAPKLLVDFVLTDELLQANADFLPQF